MSSSRRAVVAVGGNALLRPEMEGDMVGLMAAADEVAARVVTLVRRDWQVLVVHGNGPQVGIELIRSEEASTKVPPFGLDLCVANTQGSIGALLEIALRNALRTERMGRVPVAVLLTLVEVARTDSAFQHPTKPIGPWYSGYRVAQLRREVESKGWDMVEDSGRGYRTVVPSPKPLRVLAAPAIEKLMAAGFVVVGGGGGGVPITQRGAGGRLETAEAVIDKDWTSNLLAKSLKADLLIFLTAVPWVELNHGTPFARRIDAIHPDEALRHLSEGQFPAGSMGPKIEAAAEFARGGGDALITSADALESAMKGQAGTRVTLSERSIGTGKRQLPLGFEH